MSAGYDWPGRGLLYKTLISANEQTNLLVTILPLVTSVSYPGLEELLNARVAWRCSLITVNSNPQQTGNIGIHNPRFGNYIFGMSWISPSGSIGDTNVISGIAIMDLLPGDVIQLRANALTNSRIALQANGFMVTLL